MQNETARNMVEQTKHPKEGKCGSPEESLEQLRRRIGGRIWSYAHRRHGKGRKRTIRPERDI